MKKIYLLLCALLMVCSACNKSNDDLEDDAQVIMTEFDPSFVQNYGASITRDIMVQVVDTNGNTLEGVTIEVAATNKTTDDNGIAILRDASVFERFGYIKATKSGFIHASRSIAPTDGVNQIKIMMLPETIAGSTNSGEIATITNGAGASVVLNGNYINENGNEYTGTVDVILHHLDPADEDMRDQMPGMLYAQDEDGEEQGLITLGMLALELRGANGEDLNLMSGSTATITMPVDPSIISYAPATIPLWYFDEVNGVWIEEGEATLIGTEYIGEVSHFSFWNYDIPTDASVVCLVLTDEDDNALANSLVTITSPTFGTTSGTTNNDGEICGYMPNGEVLELNVYSETCNDTSLFNTNVGPFSVDTTVPVTVVLSGIVEPETVTGTISDCNGASISNGYVVVEYQGGTSTVVVEADGSFELTILRCTAVLEFTIQGNDIDGLQQSTLQTYNFTTPLTDVGNLLACETVTEYIQFNLDDGETIFFTTDIANPYLFYPNSEAPRLTIGGYAPNIEQPFFLYSVLLPDPYLGVYDSREINGPLDDLGFNIEEFFGPMLNDTMVFYLTALGEVGEYIDITFSGTFDDQDGLEHTLTGTVHVLRDN